MTDINTVHTVRNPSSTTFELFETDVTTSIDTGSSSAYSSGGTGYMVLLLYQMYKVHFLFLETITGGTSSNTADIQADVSVGFKGVTSHDFTAVKQIAMAGSIHLLLIHH